MIKVGLCGTIGSGKSTVCRLFERLGVAVYEADSHAKVLMTTSPSLRQDIIEAFGTQCYVDQQLDRAFLASQIFGDEQKRLKLNAIVHPAVCRDFVLWSEAQQGSYVIVESAILFESGLDKVVDVTIAVTAPMDVAIARAMARDNNTQEAIAARMAVQMEPEVLAKRCNFVIENVDLEALEPQIEAIDRVLRLRR